MALFWTSAGDTAATFNNNVILDQNGEVRQSRVAAGGPNTFTAGSVTFNAARTLTVNANGNLTNNLPYGLNISTVALPAAATGTIQVLNNGSGLGTVTASGAVSGIGSNLVKSGPGTLTLNFVATYTGTTAINQGTIVAGTDNVLSGGALTMGTRNTGGAQTGTVASLNLNNGSQTVVSLTVQSDSNSPNTITIGTGEDAGGECDDRQLAGGRC